MDRHGAMHNASAVQVKQHKPMHAQAAHSTGTPRTWCCMMYGTTVHTTVHHAVAALHKLFIQEGGPERTKPTSEHGMHVRQPSSVQCGALLTMDRKAVHSTLTQLRNSRR